MYETELKDCMVTVKVNAKEYIEYEQAIGTQVLEKESLDKLKALVNLCLAENNIKPGIVVYDEPATEEEPDVLIAAVKITNVKGRGRPKIEVTTNNATAFLTGQIQSIIDDPKLWMAVGSDVDEMDGSQPVLQVDLGQLQGIAEPMPEPPPEKVDPVSFF